MSISIGLYPILDLWTANKLQLQLQLPYNEKTVLKGHCIAPYVEINKVQGDMHKQEK